LIISEPKIGSIAKNFVVSRSIETTLLVKFFCFSVKQFDKALDDTSYCSTKHIPSFNEGLSLAWPVGSKSANGACIKMAIANKRAI